MFAVCVFCVVVVSYCLYNRLESRVAETAVTMAFTTIISVTGSYVFGAAWEDIRRDNVDK